MFFSRGPNFQLYPLLRWEKFAPGPVPAVTVSKGADPAIPKRRGRPPKRKDLTDGGNRHEPEVPEVPGVKPLEGE